MAEKKEGKGCRKYGCFGCLGAIALVILGGVVIATLGLIALQREPAPATEELSQEVPAVILPEAGLPLLEAGPFVSFEDFDIPPEAPGRVVLDLSMASFVVESGPPGQPIRVESDYDSARFELEQSYEADGDSGWVYRLRFGPKRSLLGLFGFNYGDEVRVILPRGVPMVLEAQISKGESELELGGLWLLEADLELGMGDHTVSFDDPLYAPMERFRLEGGMGSLRVDRLGNASPETVHVKHSMGELDLDLRGPWARDSDVTVRCGMGECSIRVPDDVAIRHQISFLMGEKRLRGLRDLPEPGEGIPTMKLDVAASMGQLSIDY